MSAELVGPGFRPPNVRPEGMRVNQRSFPEANCDQHAHTVPPDRAPSNMREQAIALSFTSMELGFRIAGAYSAGDWVRARALTAEADPRTRAYWLRIVEPVRARPSTHATGGPAALASLRWIEANQARYAGVWVALAGDRLLATARDLRALRAALGTDAKAAMLWRC